MLPNSNIWAASSALLIFVIFFGLFFGRTLEQSQTNAPELLLGGCMIFLFTIIYCGVRRQNYFTGSIFSRTGVLLAAITHLALTIAVYLHVAFAIELIHFVEFSLLAACMLFATVSKNSPTTLSAKRRSAVAATLLSATLGAIEESLQAVVPNRFFDFGDIWLNCLSAAAGGLLGYFALKKS